MSILSFYHLAFILCTNWCQASTVIGNPTIMLNISSKWFDGQPSAEDESCSVMAIKYLRKVSETFFVYQDLYQYNDSWKKYEKYITCPFNIDRILAASVFRVIPGSIFIENEESWDCAVPISNVCNGYADCLTDECGCDDGKIIFKCATQSGCIPFEQVCDGVGNCPDHSDECFCSGFIKIECASYIDIVSICLPKEKFCGIQKYDKLYENCTTHPHVDCELFNKIDVHNREPFFECIDTIYNASKVDESFQWGEVMILLSEDVEWTCYNSCSEIKGFNESWRFICDMFSIPKYYLLEFDCTINESSPSNQSVDLKIVCDNAIDCTNGADEVFCPNRFFCDPSNKSFEWVNQNKRCDNVRDCSNGRDECYGCTFGEFSSEDFLLKSPLLIFLTIIIGFCSVLLNLKCFCEGYYKIVSDSKISKVDRMFRLQINAYDSLMGIYLCCILLATIFIRMNGKYCTVDQWWRSSIFCKVLGVIFSISSHGSLIAIAFMSIIRCIQCNLLFIDINLRSTAYVSGMILLLVVTNAVLPTLKLQIIQDIFRIAIIFLHPLENPFFERFNRSKVEEMHLLFFQNKESKSSIYEMLEDLRNITTEPTIFDLTEIGYYGSTPLCIQNLFKNQVRRYRGI